MNFRNHFHFSSSEIHLNNAGFSPIPRASQEQISRCSEIFGSGFHAVSELFFAYEKARETFAQFLGTHQNSVAFSLNLSTAVSLVAHGFPWSPGDAILSLDQEYPSNAYVWYHVAQKKNLELKIFTSEKNTTIHWERFIDEIKPPVRAVVISWVQYETGILAPLTMISEACRRIGATLIVDVIQGLGALPFNMTDMGVDIACGGGHKWLCGISGLGFLAFREPLYLQMTPLIEGAMTYGTPDELTQPSREPIASAKRFESGAPPLINALATAASLRIMQEVGIQNIRATNIALHKRLVQGLQNLGFQVLGDLNSSQTSSIVTFTSPSHMPDFSETLKSHRISHAFRRGRIRLSPHAFNTIDEMDFVLSLLG